MPYEHLRLGREEPLTDRHRRQDKRPRFKPTDPREFGATLRDRFLIANERNAQADVGGFDTRRLIKIQLRTGEKMLPPFDGIEGIEIVSQEAETVVLAFATPEGLANFERRLSTLAQAGDVTRKELLYVIEDFDRWTREDRLGSALREQGMPAAKRFLLDIELWPVDQRDSRTRLINTFREWVRHLGCEITNELNQPSLVMFRIRCAAAQAEQLLEHRDVRTVDLIPSLGVSVEILTTDVNRFPVVPAPPIGAPAVVVLDAGLASGHPLVGAAVGDAQGFLAPQRDTGDREPNGHGTFVAGLALYGDVEACIRTGAFLPSLRLHAGKVFENDDHDQAEFVERAVEEAVRYFRGTYGCRVFNLSYGDRNKVYDGRHVRGLAYAPSADFYWQHGYSTENDFIYVTTQSLNAEQLRALSEEVGPDRTLLICCGAFRGDANRYPNLTVKKIPKMVLHKCEWGHDDYSLNVENLPQAPKPTKPIAPQASLFHDSKGRE